MVEEKKKVKKKSSNKNKVTNTNKGNGLKNKPKNNKVSNKNSSAIKNKRIDKKVKEENTIVNKTQIDTDFGNESYDSKKNEKKKNSFELFKVISISKDEKRSMKKAIKKNRTTKKNRKLNFFAKKCTIEVIDVLLIIVVTCIVSSVLTGIIINYQYRGGFKSYNKDLVTDEYLKKYVETYNEIKSNFYEDVDLEKMVEASLGGMFSFLSDNYSINLNEDETSFLKSSLNSAYEGIGIETYKNVILKVYDDSPASKVGMLKNDKIIKVNGVDINEENYDEISIQIKDKDEENEIIVLRGKEEITFNVKKSVVTIPAISEYKGIETSNGYVGYIALNSFSLKSYDEFSTTLEKLEKDYNIKSLIIDLRNNSGGYLNAATNISSLFIKKGEVLYSLENKKETTVYKDETKDYRSYPIVVIVNGSTASAAEILTAALKDSYGNTTIVGVTTFGKGKVQSTVDYNDTMVKYTSAKWLRPNGDCIDEVGIKPDYVVENEIVDNVVYDRQYEKALNLLYK